jgi:hypothetical protein
LPCHTVDSPLSLHRSSRANCSSNSSNRQRSSAQPPTAAFIQLHQLSLRLSTRRQSTAAATTRRHCCCTATVRCLSLLLRSHRPLPSSNTTSDSSTAVFITTTAHTHHHCCCAATVRCLHPSATAVVAQPPSAAPIQRQQPPFASCAASVCCLRPATIATAPVRQLRSLSPLPPTSNNSNGPRSPVAQPPSAASDQQQRQRPLITHSHRWTHPAPSQPKLFSNSAENSTRMRKLSTPPSVVEPTATWAS